MPPNAALPSIGVRLGMAVVSVAAALVILGVSIVPFFTPAWIHGEQDRAGSAGYVGASPSTVHGYSDGIVHDLILGGDFVVPVVDQACFGKTGACGSLLDAREQAHMRDVRGVFQGLGLLVLAGVVVLSVAGPRSRAAAEARRAMWHAVGRGARWLAVLMAAVGVLSVVAFDAAFQVFHELLFPAGSFSFDPATEVLVQLYPDQFWSDTALAVGIVAIVLSIATAWVASRRAASPAGGAAASATAGAPSSLSSRSVP